MPELPEVETTRRGIEPFLKGRRVCGVVVRDRRLRWPVPREIESQLAGGTVTSVDRRGKYILLRTDRGSGIVHLGMSGSLRVLTRPEPAGRHDHVDLELPEGIVIRYHDPRRFGCFLWTLDEPLDHRLLKNLGPEPLSKAFTPEYLYALSRGRKAAVKSFLMDARVVVGVGNIYASESLFLSGIHPKREAGRVSIARYGGLVEAVQSILQRSIELGGTTLRDFVNPAGAPGYFEQTLTAYGRAGQPCGQCGTPIRQMVIGQRSTFYCRRCQR